MLDIREEQIYRLADAARLLPPRRGGRRPHPSTLYRWARHGLRRSRLETIRVGGTLCTSLEAIQRFCERLGDGGATSSTTTSRRADRRAGRLLDQLGF